MSFSEEEDDYMSDKILSRCNDVRPGLLYNLTSKKQYENEVKHKEANEKNKVKPRKVLESEKREEGLSNAIGSENKGFALLQKMGYKPGMALGKTGSGRMDPIPINVKSDRGGLGRDEVLKRKVQENIFLKKSLTLKRQKLEAEAQDDFKSRIQAKLAEKQLLADLRKSQKVCEYLDKEKGLEKPSEKWFWLLREDEDKDEEDDDDDDNNDDDDDDEIEEEEDDKEVDELELEPSEKLEILTLYLRKAHFYCIWCGTSFENLDDLLANCPGDTFEAH